MTAHDVRCQALEIRLHAAAGAVPRARGATGGDFLRRRYVAFTGRRMGRRPFASWPMPCAGSMSACLPYGRQGHVYHLYARPLYAAIGEEDNRNRRPAEWDAVIRKLMIVDFVLAHPTARFWATEEEKVALLRERRFRPSCGPIGVTRPGGPVAARRLATSSTRCRGTRTARITVSGSPTWMPSARCRDSRRSSTSTARCSRPCRQA